MDATELGGLVLVGVLTKAERQMRKDGSGPTPFANIEVTPNAALYPMRAKFEVVDFESGEATHMGRKLVEGEFEQLVGHHVAVKVKVEASKSASDGKLYGNLAAISIVDLGVASAALHSVGATAG